MERLLDGFAEMDWNVFSLSAPMSFGRVHGLDLVATQRDQERDRRCASLSATSSASMASCMPLQVMGSASLAAQLIVHGLVDEYQLMIEPILLGGGKRLFPDDGSARRLELVSATTTATGVLICTYRPAHR
jgi:dihydrofolate reductase